MEKDKIVENILKTSPSTFRECLKRLFYRYSILKNDEYVYHYTNIDAVINGIIVENPEKDKEILLKATRWTHLNDKNELKSGLELIGGASERLSFLSDGLKQYHKKTCLLSFCTALRTLYHSSARSCRCSWYNSFLEQARRKRTFRKSI